MGKLAVIDVLAGVAGFVAVPLAADVANNLAATVMKPSSQKEMVLRLAAAHVGLGLLAFMGRGKGKFRSYRPFLTGAAVGEAFATAYVGFVAKAQLLGNTESLSSMGKTSVLAQKGVVKALLG